MPRPVPRPVPGQLGRSRPVPGQLGRSRRAQCPAIAVCVYLGPHHGHSARAHTSPGRATRAPDSYCTPRGGTGKRGSIPTEPGTSMGSTDRSVEWKHGQGRDDRPRGPDRLHRRGADPARRVFDRPPPARRGSRPARVRPAARPWRAAQTRRRSRPARVRSAAARPAWVPPGACSIGREALAGCTDAAPVPPGAGPARHGPGRFSARWPAALPATRQTGRSRPRWRA